MAKTQHGRELTGPEMVEMLDEFICRASDEDRVSFCEALAHLTHRTIQQKIASLFLNAFETWAALPEGQYDLRNEATVKIARKVKDAIKDDFFRRLPNI